MKHAAIRYKSMHLILVSDIFGKTAALMALAAELGASHVIDPYAGVNKGFNNEDEAYRYFSEHVGLHHYQRIITQQLQPLSDVTLIGFSVGAAAIWHLSNSAIATQISAAIGFYGAQIRHATALQPRFPIELIFPAQEPHFDVTQLSNSLAMTENVTSYQLPYLHGFMNLYSINYHATGYRQQRLRLKALFKMK